MKKVLLAGVGLLALGVASASAADIVQRRVVEKAPAYVAAPVYNWTGFYLGINGGGGWGSSSFSGPFATSFDTSGGLIGATLGYNWQIGQLVVGLEGDIDWTNIRGSAACGLTTCETRSDWLGTVRGRLGYAFDRFMPYITGGLAFGNVRTDIVGIGGTDSTEAGWTVGAGLEAAIAGPWTAKIEYLHVDLGSSGSIAGSSADYQTNIVRAGLNYRF